MCIIYIKGSGGLQAELHKAYSMRLRRNISGEKVAKAQTDFAASSIH